MRKYYQFSYSHRAQPGTDRFTTEFVRDALIWKYADSLTSLGDLVHPDLPAKLPNEKASYDKIFNPWVLTEALWERYHWSPKRTFIVGDVDGQSFLLESFEPTDLPSKPTWGQLLRIVEEWWLDRYSQYRHKEFSFDRYISESRDLLVTTPVEHEASSDSLSAGSGLAHMPALIYNSNRATFAGVSKSPSVLRTEKDGTATLWTERHLHGLLEQVAYRTNHVESARNIVEQKIEAHRQIAADPKGGLAAEATADEIHAARIAASDKVDAMLEPSVLDASILAEVERLSSPDAMPDDIPTLRIVYEERLEAAATARFALIKNSTTQQGVDLDPSCFDQAEGSRLISQHKQLGQVEARGIEVNALLGGAVPDEGESLGGGGFEALGIDLSLIHI